MVVYLQAHRTQDVLINIVTDQLCLIVNPSEHLFKPVRVFNIALYGSTLADMQAGR